MAINGKIILFQLDDRQLALPLNCVKRLIRAVAITPCPTLHSGMAGVINVHGQIVPVMNIREHWGLPDREISSEDLMLIVTHANRDVVIVVDGIGSILDPGEYQRYDRSPDGAISADIIHAAGITAFVDDPETYFNEACRVGKDTAKPDMLHAPAGASG